MKQLMAWVTEDGQFCKLADKFAELLRTREPAQMTIAEFAKHFELKNQWAARELYLTYLADDNARITSAKRPLECVDEAGVLDLTRFIEPVVSDVKFRRRWTWKELLAVDAARFAKATRVVLRHCFLDKHDLPHLLKFLKGLPVLKKVDLSKNCFENPEKCLKKLLKRGLVVKW